MISIDDLVTNPVNLPPLATFVATCSVARRCDVDATLSTDDSSISTYEWVWGDGASTTGATSTHAYSLPGTYTITLTATDDQGLKSVTSRTVTS